MEAGAVGADADALSATGRRFVRSSEVLRRSRAQLTTAFESSGWLGPDAARARADWTTTSDPALADASRFVEVLGLRLLEHADEQRRASRAAGADGGLTNGFGPGPTGRLHDAIDDLVGARAGDDARPRRIEDGHDGGVVGRRPHHFDRPADGRDAVLMAMLGLADEDRIAGDEIEIRALDNGRYIVVLPGVTDLSRGFDQFVARVRDDGLFGIQRAGRDAVEVWSDNDEPTVRKMRYAYEAARRDDTTVNEYSVVTIEALEAAGVPPGAEVMILGHSFGAYTAMDLAADPTVNSAHGAIPQGYHVEITHVIAAGAETDWRFDEVPAGTSTLVVNNRFDGVYRAEDLLHADGRARHEGHLEHNFWGGWQGYGHDEHNYIDWLAGTGSDGVEDWLADAGVRYTAGGTRVSVRVPDPNLSAGTRRVEPDEI